MTREDQLVKETKGDTERRAVLGGGEDVGCLAGRGFDEEGVAGGQELPDVKQLVFEARFKLLHKHPLYKLLIGLRLVILELGEFVLEGGFEGIGVFLEK